MMDEKDLNQTEDINEDEKDSTDQVNDVEIIDAVEAESVEENSELTALEEKHAKLEERLLRLQADFDNYKKRTTNEKSNLLKYKSEELGLSLLETLDNFERALQTEIPEEAKGFYDGVTMVYNQLKQALSSQGIEVMETEKKEFDPNLHHAVMQTEDENFESNIVVEELQKGYMIKDKVLRPAMVKVNK